MLPNKIIDNKREIEKQIPRGDDFEPFMTIYLTEKTNINDFFCFMGLSVPKQMTEPNKWHNMIEEYLKTKIMVFILMLDVSILLKTIILIYFLKKDGMD